jgi:predicted double-glycine peptidase
MGLVLRVTQRCLAEDFGLPADALKQSTLEEVAGSIPAIAAFCEKRSQNPEGLEKVQPLTSNVVVYTLHAGEIRGATWHDRRAGTVWLLAARFHRSGKKDDAYPYFKELDAGGRLLPSAKITSR